MKAIKIIYGGGYKEEHNLEEVKEFLKGEDFGYIINGGKSKRKPSNWAQLVSVAVKSGQDVVVAYAGEYLIKDRDKFYTLSGEEYEFLYG